MNAGVNISGTIALHIKKISLDGPWSWLAAGSRDLMRKPALSLGYGLLFAVVSVAIVYLTFALDMAAFAMALGGGFMLIGPMLAVGLYEMSHRYEQGKEVSADKVFFVGTKSPTQLAFLGALLMIALLIWIRIATLLFALFWGTKEFPPLVEFLPTLLFTTDGLSLLIIGSITGGLLAFAVYGMSVISVPLLMERDVDAITAIIASFIAIKTNFWPMMLWALLIAGLTAIGIATLFVGLIFTFPLVGHGTWHAYRALVD
ncbi:MAG: DUF2189 domain-containing protein [Sphingomonadales bacterium]|jgi:uncharacterized membrane protein